MAFELNLAPVFFVYLAILLGLRPGPLFALGIALTAWSAGWMGPTTTGATIPCELVLDVRMEVSSSIDDDVVDVVVNDVSV